jgi:hypothetical protein
METNRSERIRRRIVDAFASHGNVYFGPEMKKTSPLPQRM